MLTNKTSIIDTQKKMKACDISLTCIKNKSGSKIEPWGTPWDTDPGWQKSLPKLTKNDLLERWDLNQLTVYFEKPIAFNFCDSKSWSIASKAFRISIGIIPVMIPLWKLFCWGGRIPWKQKIWKQYSKTMTR